MVYTLDFQVEINIIPAAKNVDNFTLYKPKKSPKK